MFKLLERINDDDDDDLQRFPHPHCILLKADRKNNCRNMESGLRRKIREKEMENRKAECRLLALPNCHEHTEEERLPGLYKKRIRLT